MKKPPLYNVIHLSKSRTRLEKYTSILHREKSLRNKERLGPSVINTFNRIVFLTAVHYKNQHVQATLKKETCSKLNELDLALPHTKSYIGSKDLRHGKELREVHPNTVSNHIKKLKEFGLLKQIPSKSKTLLLINHHLIEFEDNFKHLHAYFAPTFPKLKLTENKGFNRLSPQSLLAMYPNIDTFNNQLVTQSEKPFFDNNNFEEKKYLNIEQTISLKKNIHKETTKTRFNRKNEETTLTTPEKLLSDYDLKVQGKDRNTERLVNDTWNWCVENLYNFEDPKCDLEYISDSQEEIAKENIRKRIIEANGKSNSDNYIKLNDELKLFKNWEKRTFIPIPSIFFNPKNEKGLTMASKWLKINHKEEQEKRAYRYIKKVFRNVTKVWNDDTISIFEKNKILNSKDSFVSKKFKNKNPDVYKHWKEQIIKVVEGEKDVKISKFFKSINHKKSS